MILMARLSWSFYTADKYDMSVCFMQLKPCAQGTVEQSDTKS